MKHTTRLLAGLLAALTLSGSTSLMTTATLATESAPATYNGTPITEHEGGYDYYDRTVVTHTYDFSMERLSFYAGDAALAMSNRAAAEIRDGALVTKEGMAFSIGSNAGLGDDYGLEEGYFHFDLKLTAGKAALGLRLSKAAATPEDRGIWITLDGSDKLTLRETDTGLSATLPMPLGLSEARTFTVHEGRDTITLSSEDTTLAVIRYAEGGHLAFCDAAGKTVAETDKCTLDPTGFCAVYLDDITGFVDDLIFTNVELSRDIPAAEELRVIDYSTWTATDDLGRTVADFKAAGEEKDNRYVGLFYFLCWTGAGGVVSDNTKDYLTYGADGIRDRIEERAGEAYWAEPYFGYYRNTDTWVYRKHAYMLEAAGVDFIFLDVSNGEVFIPGHTALFDTWLQMRREGNDTPQIVFFNGDRTDFMESNMRQLFTTVYSDENWSKYQELFFCWENKPLVFGNMSDVSSDLENKINEKFTVRGSWAWMNKDNYWSWLQEYTTPENSRRPSLINGGWGRNAEGKYESLSIAMGHHPATSKGRSFVNGVQPNNKLGDFEFSEIERAGLGLGFEFQYNAATALIDWRVSKRDPFVLMITGWNEWIAGGFTEDERKPFANTECQVTYVDQFNPEFSRDGEPMRNQDGYGIGDNYYYQMVDYIRKYKGMSETPVADHQGSINIYDAATWDAIRQCYMDPLYDVELRNTICYDASYRYINNTGRNDFDYAKVSQDDHYLYFLATTVSDIIVDNGENWMNLYLNTDGNSATGWSGFDYVLNRDRDSFVVTVEKFKGDTFETEVVGGAYYAIDGNQMSVRLSKDLVGITGNASGMIFKWADNSVTNGDPMAFMDLGDAAPDSRFGFLYLCDEYTTSAVPETVLITADGITTVKNATVERPDPDRHVTVEATKVDVLYNANEMPSGEYIQYTPIADQFEFSGGTAQSTARIVKNRVRQYMVLDGIADLRTWKDVEGRYEFSLDVHMLQYGNSAIYIRGEMPGAYAPTNPSNHNVQQVFNYYEWDWYRENGGKIYGGSSTAGSGIGIYPLEDSIMVRIKRYAEDGLGVASASYTFPYSESFSPTADGWFKLRVTDDEEIVTIYFNDIVMCSVKLEDATAVYESDGTGQTYYRKATLRDAAGTEVLEVENTRVNSSGSQIAMTVRGQTMEFDNIYIAYDSQTTEGGRTEAPLGTTATEAPFTPETDLVTTLNLGQNPLILSDTPVIPGPADTTAPGEGETNPGDGTAPGNKGCKSALALPAVGLLVAMAACLSCKRRD